MAAADERTITKKTYLCLHCGNETLMQRVGNFSWGSKETGDDFFGFTYQYQLFFCPVCNKVTLLQTYGDEDMIDYGDNDRLDYYTTDTILYPVNTIESKMMPVEIRNAFESALKVRNVDAGACAIMLRRTLDKILSEQGATKWGLEGKIEEIAEKGLLPESLKEASSFAKKFGDSVAHWKELVPDESDINSLVEFIQYIIDYLYIIPAKIKQFQEKMDRTSEDAPF